MRLGRRRVWKREDARRGARRRGACHRGRPASRISARARGRAIERTRARSARAALGMAAGTEQIGVCVARPASGAASGANTARGTKRIEPARARRDQPVLCGVLFAAAYAALRAVVGRRRRRVSSAAAGIASCAPGETPRDRVLVHGAGSPPGPTRAGAWPAPAPAAATRRWWRSGQACDSTGLEVELLFLVRPPPPRVPPLCSVRALLARAAALAAHLLFRVSSGVTTTEFFAVGRRRCCRLTAGRGGAADTVAIRPIFVTWRSQRPGE